LAMQGGVVVGEGAKPGTKRVFRPGGYGTYDVNSWLSKFKAGDIVGLVDEVAKSTYPQLSVPYQQLRGKDLLTNRELTGGPITGPDFLKALFTTEAGRKMAHKWGITINKDGVVKAPDRLVITLRAIPHLRVPGLLAAASKPDKQSLYRAQSFLSGIQETERNPALGAHFQMKNTKVKIAEAKALLRRYPKEAWPLVVQQYPAEVRRALAKQGYPILPVEER
jgi:hypothetical protein